MGTFLRAFTLCHIRQLDSVAAQLRRGSANSNRGAARLVAEALATAKKTGATGLLVLRADSADCNADAVAAVRRAGARFSITARMDPAVTAAVAGIAEDAWTPIRYPNAIFDDDEQRWVSTRRSPRSPSPRSPAGPEPTRWSTGWWCAASRDSTLLATHRAPQPARPLPSHRWRVSSTAQKPPPMAPVRAMSAMSGVANGEGISCVAASTS